MQIRRIVWFGLASIAVATWLTAASAPDVRPPAAPLVPEPPARLDTSSATLQAEITRLHARIGPTAVPEGRRDLFRFSARAPRPTRQAVRRPVDAVPEAAPMPAVIPAVPPLALIGVAEDASPDGPVRTAIVSGLGDVFLVKPGESISGRFRVAAVSPASVDIVDITTSVQTTLTLH